MFGAEEQMIRDDMKRWFMGVFNALHTERIFLPGTRTQEEAGIVWSHNVLRVLDFNCGIPEIWLAYFDTFGVKERER